MGVPVRGLDLVQVASPTEGTGTLSLGSASPGFLHPSNALLGAVSGGRYTFLHRSADRLTWELIEGVLTSGSPWTLTREVVVTSAGNSTPINWSNATHGARTLSCVTRADRMALLENDGRVRAANLGNVLLATINDTWVGPLTVGGVVAVRGLGVPIGTRRVFITANGRNRVNGTTGGEARIVRRVLAAGGGSVLDDTTFSGSITNPTDPDEFWAGGVWYDYGAPITEVREVQMVLWAFSGSFIAQNIWWSLEAWGV